MAPKKPCFQFQLGRCNNGDRCRFGHFQDPNFKRKPCHQFARGKCRKGDACTYSHDVDDDTADPQDIADPEADAGKTMSGPTYRWWKRKSPYKLDRYIPLDSDEKAEYWRATYDLTQAEAGVMQDVFIWLAGDVGIKRVKEIVDLKLQDMHQRELAKTFDEQLLWL